MENTLLFMHIPKMGGSTLLGMIFSHFPEKAIFKIGKNIEKLNILKNMPYRERSQIRCITGHFYYGIHKFIQGYPTYMTFLRDPLEQMVSFHFYSYKNSDLSTFEAFVD